MATCGGAIDAAISYFFCWDFKTEFVFALLVFQTAVILKLISTGTACASKKTYFRVVSGN